MECQCFYFKILLYNSHLHSQNILLELVNVHCIFLPIFSRLGIYFFYLHKYPPYFKKWLLRTQDVFEKRFEQQLDNNGLQKWSLLLY